MARLGVASVRVPRTKARWPSAGGGGEVRADAGELRRDGFALQCEGVGLAHREGARPLRREADAHQRRVVFQKAQDSLAPARDRAVVDHAGADGGVEGRAQD